MAASTPTSNPFTNAPTDKVASYFFTNTNAPRVNTDAYLYDVIQNRHPGLTVTIVPEFNANLKAYAAANPNTASVHPVHPETDSQQDITDTQSPPLPVPSVEPRPPHKWPSSLKWTLYAPPTDRISGAPGQLVQETFYDSFLYHYKSFQFLVYLIDGRDGNALSANIRNQYIVSPSTSPVHAMLKEVGEWSATLHNEIWVFNQGYWSKDPSLYAAIQKSRWEDVILPEDLKKELMDVATQFFDEKTRKTYHRLRVPWKRGIIFYGPPGNGKTISIKATMHSLYKKDKPVPTLYVKSLTSFGGPEWSVNLIFEKARSYAPCYLVFEDLDSLVTPQVRSFFLNAVDGVSENEGILMVGSTNHLSRLDDGISKRPSRFDRKYEFGLPDGEMRRSYCQFWQKKLRERREEEEGSEDGVVQEDEKEGQIEFPDVLVDKIAGITDGFSFAYMQEAFVSALLIIAGRHDGDAHTHHHAKAKEEVEEVRDGFEIVCLNENPGKAAKDRDGPDDDDDDDDLDRYVLWREIKVQVALLKKEIGKDAEG